MKKAATALLALGMLAPALSQDVDRDDVPRQCESVCANIVTVSDECDRQFNRDRDELDCMCRADNAQEVIPLCAACIDFYDTDNDDDDDDIEDNDAGDLRRECGFAQTSFDPSSTYSVPQMTAATNLGSSSRNAGPTPTSNQASLSSALNSVSSNLVTATSTDQASLSSVINSISSDVASQATSAAGAANTDNAAVNKEGAQAAIAGVALLAAAALL